MEGMKRLENREALELFRKALRASAIGLLSHVEAVQSQSVLWGTPQGAEFQESLYWVNLVGRRVVVSRVQRKER